MQVRVAGLSDVGRSRSHNEDSLGIESDRGLFVVADGMGGHGHGDIASRLAVEAICEFLRSDEGQRLEQQAGVAPAERRRRLGSVLEIAIKQAHRRVVEAVYEDHHLEGMGTTVVGMLVDGASAAVAHVGDSRAYLLRGDRLEQVTEDHTWVYEQVKAGYLSHEQARSHPLKSVVTRAVGGDHAIEVDVRGIALNPGDLFLLCSDGLTTMLDDEQILGHLVVKGSLEERCQLLVDDANRHGGVDNISVILLEIVAE